MFSSKELWVVHMTNPFPYHPLNNSVRLVRLRGNDWLKVILQGKMYTDHNIKL